MFIQQSEEENAFPILFPLNFATNDPSKIHGNQILFLKVN